MVKKTFDSKYWLRSEMQASSKRAKNDEGVGPLNESQITQLHLKRKKKKMRRREIGIGRTIQMLVSGQLAFNQLWSRTRFSLSLSLSFDLMCHKNNTQSVERCEWTGNAGQERFGIADSGECNESKLKWSSSWCSYRIRLSNLEAVAGSGTTCVAWPMPLDFLRHHCRR